MAESHECEQLIMKEAGIQTKETYQPTDFEAVDLKFFSKASPKLLRAFIKFRELQDLSTPGSLDPMPNKGTLKDARSNNTCKKTGKRTLIQWAFEVRTKNPNPTVSAPSSETERQSEVDRIVYEEAIDEFDGGEAVAFEDIVHTDALAKASGVEVSETDGHDGVEYLDEADSDSDYDCSVGSDEEE
jgi:hypothetical protein